MAKHLSHDLDRLQARLLEMAQAVERMLYQSTRTLNPTEKTDADVTPIDDDMIDAMENELQEECLKLLALHQPVAIDLRRIMVVFHSSTDLERIADLACDIAERTQDLPNYPTLVIPDSMPRLTDFVAGMVRSALESFVSMDSMQARRVIRLDEEADRLSVEAINNLVAQMKQNPELVEPCVSLFSVSRHLERIGDHATNIAEDVVYLVDAELVRHRSGTRLPAL